MGLAIAMVSERSWVVLRVTMIKPIILSSLGRLMRSIIDSTMRVLMIVTMVVICISISSDAIGFYSLSDLTIVGSNNPLGGSIDVVKDRVIIAMMI